MNDVLRFYPVISGFPTLLVIFEFFYFIKRDRRLLRWGSVALEVMILVVPFVLLRAYEMVLGMKLGEAIFDPAYGWCLYTLIVLCQLDYFYCSLRKKMASPFWEVMINSLLILGVLLNIIIAIQLAALPGICTICLPATLLFILMLVNNHRLVRADHRYAGRRPIIRGARGWFIFSGEPRKAHNTLEDVDVDLSEPAPTRGRLFKICMRILQWPSLFSKNLFQRKAVDPDK